MADRAQHQAEGSGRRAWRKIIAGTLFAAAGLYILFRKLLRDSKRGSEPRVVMANADVERENPVTAFEPTDWELAPVGWIYIGVLALLVISCVVLIAAYPNALPDVGRRLRINPPGPRLQTNAAADLRRFRAEEAQRLNGYYWVDKQKGLVHIPIEEEMKKLVQTGIDGFPKAQQ
jgi:hypothetical protein